MNKKGKKNFLPPSFRPSHMSRCYTSSSHSCFLKISGLQVTNITVLTIHVVRWLHFYAGEAEKWSPWPGSYLLEEEYKEMRSPCSWWTVSHHFHKHTWPWVTFILGLDFGFFFFGEGVLGTIYDSKVQEWGEFYLRHWHLSSAFPICSNILFVWGGSSRLVLTSWSSCLNLLSSRD
jgi:hypothetical protein